jgi:hypothetical protein
MLPLEPASHPKLEASDRFHLPIIGAMEMPFSGPDMGRAHQSLNSSKVIPVVKKGSSEGVTDNMRMNPFPNQSLFRQGFYETINSPGGKPPLLTKIRFDRLCQEKFLSILPIYKP